MYAFASTPSLPFRPNVLYGEFLELSAFLKQNHGTLDNEKWHPIGYLSRTLRDYEKRYAQIEKESLSIVFGVEFFYEYL